MITGKQLLHWRSRRDMTLEEVGNLLGGVSGPTVSRWENGQEIPAPVQMLLEWLINGKVPFQTSMLPDQLKNAMWRVEMDLEAWEKLDALRLAGGFATVTDWIAAMIQDELHATPAPRGLMALSSEDTNPPPITETRREVQYGETNLSGAKASASKEALAAARAYEKANPPPPAAPRAAEPVRTHPSRGRRKKPAPGPEGTPAGNE